MSDLGSAIALAWTRVGLRPSTPNGHVGGHMPWRGWCAPRVALRQTWRRGTELEPHDLEGSNLREILVDWWNPRCLVPNSGHCKEVEIRLVVVGLRWKNIRRAPPAWSGASRSRAQECNEVSWPPPCCSSCCNPPKNKPNSRGNLPALPEGQGAKRSRPLRE